MELTETVMGKYITQPWLGSENQRSEINHVAIRREQATTRLVQAELSF